MLADLDSAKDVDGATRNSPAAKQNETGRWRSKKKEEREQPRINVAATGDITRAGLLSSVVTLRGSSG